MEVEDCCCEYDYLKVVYCQKRVTFHNNHAKTVIYLIFVHDSNPRITEIKERSETTYTTGEPAVLYCELDYTIGGNAPSEAQWTRFPEDQIIESTSSGVYSIGKWAVYSIGK